MMDAAGKTSVREAIAADLEPVVAAVELRHLGTVPDPPTVQWRQRRAEANQAALQWVTDAIAGRAPAFRRGATSTR